MAIQNKMTPLLSILIPAIPTRFDMARKLYYHVESLIGDKNIEIIIFLDNKSMTIGEKREALKNSSRGKYFMFVDDDDDLLSIDELYEAAQQDVDVITFKVECRNDDGSTYIVTHGLGNEIEHNTKDGKYLDCKRPPFHNCAWRSVFKKFSYPAVNYSEDWEFVKQCLPFAFTSIHIDKVLTRYNFDSRVSEASTVSTEYWKNPNGKESDNWKGLVKAINDTYKGPDNFAAIPIHPDVDKYQNNPNWHPSDPFNERLQYFADTINNGKTPPPRRAIVCLATEKYWKGMERLHRSLQEFTDVDKYWFKSESEVAAPPHSDNPYAFKIYAIETVRNLGYDQILWLDASVYAVKPIQPVFDWLDKNEVFMEEAGHWAGTWSPDYVLNYFKITKEQAMKMPMFSAGFTGIDFRTFTGQEFFIRWQNAMQEGMFKGSWSNHRHDLTCASIIANQMGLVDRYSPGGQFFAYVGPGYREPKESAVFHLKGVV